MRFAARRAPNPIDDRVVVVTRLGVDMTRCDRWGYCAEVLPEIISLDEWGYPVIRPPGVSVDEHLDHARHAVRACPRRALRLEEERDLTR
jgi:ferredoxin